MGRFQERSAFPIHVPLCCSRAPTQTLLLHRESAPGLGSCASQSVFSCRLCGLGGVGEREPQNKDNTVGWWLIRGLLRMCCTLLMPTRRPVKNVSKLTTVNHINIRYQKREGVTECSCMTRTRKGGSHAVLWESPDLNDSGGWSTIPVDFRPPFFYGVIFSPDHL